MIYEIFANSIKINWFTFWSISLYLAISNNPHECWVYDIYSVSVANTVVSPHTTKSIMWTTIGIKYFCSSTKYSVRIGSGDWELFTVVASFKINFNKGNIKATSSKDIYKNTGKIEHEAKFEIIKAMYSSPNFSV